MGDLIYYEGMQRIRVINPSLEDIKRCILALDNAHHTYVKLYAERGYVHVVGGAEGRVNVAYADYDLNMETFQAGVLLDDAFAEDAGEITLAIQDEMNPVPLQRTVTKDRALEVVAYFAEHQSFPEGSAWHGWMEDVSG